VYEKNFLAFFLVEHLVIREKGRIGKDQVVNLLRTDVPSSQYRRFADFSIQDESKQLYDPRIAKNLSLNPT